VRNLASFLDAADKWLVAVETQELKGKTKSLQLELAEMEAELAVTVRAWRLAGGRESGYV
jgi:hypothetical protein